MKGLSILLLLLLLTSCSLFKDDDTINGENLLTTSFRTGRFMAPVSSGAPLVQLYNKRAELLEIKSGDLLRIRFFDVDADSHEDTVKVGSGVSTLSDLINQIDAKIEASGAATVEVSLDTVYPGFVNIAILSGGPIYNVNVENVSNPESAPLLKDVFVWNGMLTGRENRSEGKCIGYASSGSNLLSLMDSNGLGIGLEVGDTVRVNGMFDGLEIDVSRHLFQITDSSDRLSDLVGFMRGTAYTYDTVRISFGFYGFSTPHMSGSIGMNILDFDTTTDTFSVYSSNSNSNEIAPTNFTANMVFLEINEGNIWEQDSTEQGGFEQDSL